MNSGKLLVCALVSVQVSFGMYKVESTPSSALYEFRNYQQNLANNARLKLVAAQHMLCTVPERLTGHLSLHSLAKEAVDYLIVLRRVEKERTAYEKIGVDCRFIPATLDALESLIIWLIAQPEFDRETRELIAFYTNIFKPQHAENSAQWQHRQLVV